MQGKDLIGIGAIAVGGYFVLKEMFGIDLLNFGATEVTPTATSPQATNPQVTAAATTRTQVLNAIRASGLDMTVNHTVDEYNWFYQKVRGRPGPGSLFPSDPTGSLYTYDEWWNAMVGAGFSGLGVVANQVIQPTRFNTIQTSGWERMSKRFN